MGNVLRDPDEDVEPFPNLESLKNVLGDPDENVKQLSSLGNYGKHAKTIM